MYQYHIKIRGEKEPFILEGERGKKLKLAFDNNEIKDDQWVSFGDESSSYRGKQIDGIKAIYVPEKKGAIEYPPVSEEERAKVAQMARQVLEKLRGNINL